MIGKKSLRIISSLGKLALLIMISIIVGLCVSEFAVRTLGYEPTFSSQAFWQYDPLLGWRNKPGANGHMNKKNEFTTRVRINSKGLRDREHTYQKSARARRILVLGDSFVWGHGVEYDAMFTTLMEDGLSNVEVINAGVAGYSTDQELLWFGSEGKKYDPDVVVLLLVYNDIFANDAEFIYNSYYKPRFVRQSNGLLVLTNVPCPTGSYSERLRRFVVRNSGLASLLTTVYPSLGRSIENWIFALIGSDASVNHHSSDFAEDLTAELVTRLQRSVIAVGADFFVAALSGGHPECESVVSKLRERGLEVLWIDDLRGYRPKEMKFHIDSHWNADGHKFVAKVITESLKYRGWVPLEVVAKPH